MGAEVNAGTGKETTSVYSRFLDNHLERAFDVLQDMVLRPAYPDIDSERQVVIEEIAMYEDEPQDKVHDVLAGAIFGDHPLGRPIIGRADVVSSVPVPEIAHGTTAATCRQHRAGGRGNLEHDRIVELAEGGREGRPPPPARQDAPEAPARCCASTRRRPSSTTCARRGRHPARRRAPLRAARARHDPRRLDLVAAVPGGAREARARLLRLLVREPLRRHRPGGALLGTRPDNGEAVDVIGSELRRLQADGVTEEELERARDNVKGRTVLSMESTLTRMNRLGSSVLMDVPLLTVDEVLAAFDAVTLDDVNGLARELWQPERMSARSRRRRGRFRRRARGRLAGARRGMINVAVSGRAGRMGATVCDAVEGAEDMALVGRADPLIETSLLDVLAMPMWSWTSPPRTPHWRTHDIALRQGSTA